MMGRVILVLNSEYSENTDLLCHSSNRPEEHFRRAITAPGTGITALTDVDDFTTKTRTSIATPIVSGVLAQLLQDFQGRREFFVEHGLCMDNAFKGIIIKGLLDNAQKLGLNGKILGPIFGQGIVDYQNAYHKIQDEFDRLFLEKKNVLSVDLIRIGHKIQTNEINRELENRRRELGNEKSEIEREKREKEKKKLEEERAKEEFENRTRLKLIRDAKRELEIIQRHLQLHQEKENIEREKEKKKTDEYNLEEERRRNREEWDRFHKIRAQRERQREKEST